MKRFFMSVLITAVVAISLQAQVTLQLQPQTAADRGFRISGIAGFSVVAPPSDMVWVEDSLSSTAQMVAEGGDGWNWISTNPAPFSGAKAHQSNLAAGPHQHYFYWSDPVLTVNAGDSLVAYVYLDPANPPSEVMLQWNNGNWDHRAYWGKDQLILNGTRYYMGQLPPVGQWVRLEVPASVVGLGGWQVNGMAFTLYGGRATWDHAGKTSAPRRPNDTVWVEDNPAPGTLNPEQDGWRWISSNPAPFSGNSAHESPAAAGIHQHYFSGSTFPVKTGESLVAYVYLDPANPPSQVMLQWYEAEMGWEHRAYWGQNLITWGIDGRHSRYNMGPLPPVGQWARLEVPASIVGLEGKTLTGMAFTLFGGRAVWDHAGKTAAYGSDQYYVYGQASIPRGRWSADGPFHRDYFHDSLSGNLEVSQDIDNCSGSKDPREWNPRCIDNIMLLTKNFSCLPNSPAYACQDNDFWNGYPGRSNMSTFSVRPPVKDRGFGWPLNDSWGVKNFPPLISKNSVNNRQPSPPPTSDLAVRQCHPHNPGNFATSTGNSKVAQVKFVDGTTRWFMAFNSMVHDELAGSPPGFSGSDNWRMQWAWSNDGKSWTVDSKPLMMDISETVNCWQGILVTDMFYDIDNTDASNPKPYFYILATTVLTDNVWLFRSPVVQSSVTGYDTTWGWEVRGAVESSTGKNRWIRIPPSQLGTQIDFPAIGAKSILPTRFTNWGNAVKQTTIGRVFASSQPYSPSKYVALTVDRDASTCANNDCMDVLQLWTADNLNTPFVFQSTVGNESTAPFGGYGFEAAFLHYPDNNQDTPRLFDNEFELWFVVAETSCGTARCSPGYEGQATLTTSRRRARLSGGIYGP